MSKLLNNPIQIEGGLVSGIAGNRQGIAVFKGLPYAAPPTGDLRWREPQPVLPWDGVREASQFGCKCVQLAPPDGSFYHHEFYRETTPMSEDCLFLNVWAPDAADGAKRPVMLWIHGGGFMGGFGHEIENDGEGLAARGMILVTINYRLGVFGFLAHPELSAESENGVSGNYGILDQIAALRWVQKNIAKFGGDPDNVTIAGQSAGAMSVQTLLASPLTRGLFSRAILQSGGGIHVLVDNQPLAAAEQNGRKLAGHLGAASIHDMRAIPATDLLKNLLPIEMRSRDKNAFRLAPVIDGFVLPDDASEVILQNSQQDADIMIGSNADDMRLPFAAKPADPLPQDNSMAEKLQAAAIDLARLWDAQKRKPAYVYSFDRPLPGDNAGAFHTGEVWYVFETLDRCWRPLTAADHRLAARMADYWANFARTGDPNGPGLPRWQPCTGDKPAVMHLNIDE